MKPLPDRVKGKWWMRHLPKIGLGFGLFVLGMMPVIFNQPSQSYLWTRVVIFAIAACSLTVLTGWAGQLSLGQFAFVGLGAILSAALVRGMEFDIFGWHIELPTSTSRSPSTNGSDEFGVGMVVSLVQILSRMPSSSGADLRKASG